MEDTYGFRELMNENDVKANEIDADYISTNSGIIVTANSNQLIFGSPFTTTISIDEPVANRIYHIQDAGADATFVLTEGSYNLNGNYTINGTLSVPGTFSVGTVQASVEVDTNKIAPYSGNDVNLYGNLLPDVNNTRVLGSGGNRWASAAVGTLIATTSNAGTGNGTTLNYTTGNITNVNSTSVQSSTVKCDNLNTNSGVNIAVTASLNPSADITYSLGNSSNNWLNLYSHNVNSTNVNTINTYTNSISPNSGTSITLNGNITGSIIPTTNNTYNIGSSSNRYANTDSEIVYTEQIITRLGTFGIYPSNNSIQANANMWLNTSGTGGSTSTTYAQNIFAGGDTTLYLGNINDSSFRCTIQSYKQTAFDAVPLVLQPFSSSNSRVVIGPYNAGASSATDILYITGNIKTTGNISAASGTITGNNLVVNNNATISNDLSVLSINALSSDQSTLALGRDGSSVHTLNIAGNLNCQQSGATGYCKIGTGVDLIKLLGAPVNINTTGALTTTIGNTSATNAITGANTILGTTTINTTGTSTTSIGVAGTQTTIQGAAIKFLNNVTSSVPTELNVYEEINYLSTINGPWAVGSNPTFTMKVVRLNNVCQLSYFSFSQAASTPGNMQTVTPLQTRFRPTTSSFIDTILVLSNSVKQFGYIEVLTNGQINWNAGPVTTSFASTGNAGVFGHTISWNIT